MFLKRWKSGRKAAQNLREALHYPKNNTTTFHPAYKAICVWDCASEVSQHNRNWFSCTLSPNDTWKYQPYVLPEIVIVLAGILWDQNSCLVFAEVIIVIPALNGKQTTIGGMGKWEENSHLPSIFEQAEISLRSLSSSSNYKTFLPHNHAIYHYCHAPFSVITVVSLMSITCPRGR